MVTDGSEAITATNRTNEFGNSTVAASSSNQAFGHTGEPVDPTGLSYLCARYYDPTVGRFLNRTVKRTAFLGDSADWILGGLAGRLFVDAPSLGLTLDRQPAVAFSERVIPNAFRRFSMNSPGWPGVLSWSLAKSLFASGGQALAGSLLNPPFAAASGVIKQPSGYRLWR